MIQRDSNVAIVVKYLLKAEDLKIILILIQVCIKRNMPTTTYYTQIILLFLNSISLSTKYSSTINPLFISSSQTGFDYDFVISFEMSCQERCAN